jgi:hypothetical protein
MTNFENPELYVGCGLTLASEEFKAQVEELKVRLSEEWEIMQFLGLVAGSAEDVYRKDIIENVGGSKAFLGVCDEPSIGLGWELCEATRLQKPTLAVAHVGSKVTRMVLGAPAFNPTMTFRRYENMVEDVPAIVLEEFTVVRNSIIRP